MKKLLMVSIFSFLIILSLQQMIFAEDENDKAIEARAQTLSEAARDEKAANEAARDEKESNEAANAARDKEVAEAGKHLKRYGNLENEKEIEEEEIKYEKIKIPSKLKKLLPTEKELEDITIRTIWKYVDNQSTSNDETGIETMTSLLRDISRVYDPVVNKYKVATIQIKIIKYDDKDQLETYWNEETSTSIEEIFDKAYLIGSPDDNTNCMFNYSEKGSITLCKTNEYVVQTIISDEYGEHFSYNKLKVGPKKLQLNQDEMTTAIVEEIMKKIGKNNDVEIDYELHKILQSNREAKEKELREKEIMNSEEEENKKNNDLKEKQKKNKILGIEKDKKYGIQNFSCVKDEFGLVTISGQFNNNEIKKEKVVLEILFLDYEKNIIFKNTANLLEISEFETKRFLGNTKIDKLFSTCTIKTDI